MKLIVGLGNPGAKYEKTRHNLGFSVVDAFFKNFASVKDTKWDDSRKFLSDIADLRWQPKIGKEEKIILAKPKTFMNNSGLAVKKIMDFYKIEVSDLWIIHDEIDISLGNMKIRLGGSSAGHRGVESVIKHIKSEKFWRFRMGIGKDQAKKPGKQKVKPTDTLVLGEFTMGEKGKARKSVKRGAEAVESALEKGLTTATNRFNSK